MRGSMESAGLSSLPQAANLRGSENSQQRSGREIPNHFDPTLFLRSPVISALFRSSLDASHGMLPAPSAPRSRPLLHPSCPAYVSPDTPPIGMLTKKMPVKTSKSELHLRPNHRLRSPMRSERLSHSDVFKGILDILPAIFWAMDCPISAFKSPSQRYFLPSVSTNMKG